jgi:chromate transporter
MACLQAMVVALIASTALRMLLNALFKTGSLTLPLGPMDIMALVIFVIFLFIKRKWKLDPLKIVIGSGLAGILLYYVF